MRYGITVVVIAFLAIVTTIVLIGSDDNQNASTPARNTVLADYDDNASASVSWTQQGRLVGEDEHRAIRITITRDKRTVEVLAGYAQRVEKSSDFTNSPEAFASFVRALDNLNFGRERDVQQPDERGICPTGYRFIYKLTDMSAEIMRTWSDSCSNADGPFGGESAGLIGKLFKAQITDYNTFTKGVKL